MYTEELFAEVLHTVEQVTVEVGQHLDKVQPVVEVLVDNMVLLPLADMNNKDSSACYMLMDMSDKHPTLLDYEYLFSPHYMKVALEPAVDNNLLELVTCFFLSLINVPVCIIHVNGNNCLFFKNFSLFCNISS